MRSLIALPAICLTTCNAAAVNSSRHIRDVTIGSLLQESPTAPSVLLPAAIPSNPASSRPYSTGAPISPTTRPFLTADAASIPPESSTSKTSSDPQSTPLALDRAKICTNITTNPDLANYIQPYTCTLKPGADYAILGMYYDACSLLDLSPSASASLSNAAPTTAITIPPLPVSPSSETASTSSATSSLASYSSANTAPIDTLFCCDPTYSEPQTFETLCIWRNATNIAKLPPDFDPKNITRPQGAAGVGRCTVRPVIRPKARCVQLGQQEVGLLGVQ